MFPPRFEPWWDSVATVINPNQCSGGESIGHLIIYFRILQTIGHTFYRLKLSLSNCWIIVDHKKPTINFWTHFHKWKQQRFVCILLQTLAPSSGRILKTLWCSQNLWKSRFPNFTVPTEFWSNVKTKRCLTHSVSDQWQGHLLSCLWTAKKTPGALVQQQHGVGQDSRFL